VLHHLRRHVADRASLVLSAPHLQQIDNGILSQSVKHDAIFAEALALFLVHHLLPFVPKAVGAGVCVGPNAGMQHNAIAGRYLLDPFPIDRVDRYPDGLFRFLSRHGDYVLSSLRPDHCQHVTVALADDVGRWKLMGMGALGVVGITAAALGVTFADVIKRVLTMGRY